MGIFNKKGQAKPKTLQDITGAFNQLLYKLGDLNFRKALIQKDNTTLEQEIQKVKAELDKLNEQGFRVRAKMQEEVEKTAAQGAASETKAS